ncbi:MAG: hypothetical protein ACLVAW_19770 [Eisenbergiella massiliensis]
MEQGSVSYVMLLPVLSAIMALAGVAGFSSGEMLFLPYVGAGTQLLSDLRQLCGTHGDYGLVDLLRLSASQLFPGKAADRLLADGNLSTDAFVYNTLLYLTVFTFARGNNRFLQACVLAAACCISFLPACIPHLYEKTMLWLWVAALVAAGSLVAAELYCLAGKLERGEELCWN